MSEVAGALDEQDVGAAVVAGVDDVDAAVADTPEADDGGVGAGAAVEGEALAVHRVGAGGVGHGVDDEPVGAALAVDPGGAADGLDEDAVVSGTGVDDRGPGEGVVDRQHVVAGAEGEVEGLEAGVAEVAVAHLRHGR